MMRTLKSMLNMTYEPVATLWADEVPEGAVSFGEGKRGCVMSLFASAAKGRTGAVCSKTSGCPGGGVGMGYGNHYENVFPGGQDCFCHFLSAGNSGFPMGEAVAGHMKGKAPEAFVEEFLHGERYVKTPELVKNFIQEVGIIDLGEKVTVFKPLSDALAAGETPVTVTFVCTPAQLSALVILCNYFREGIENVASPYVAGCQSIGVVTYREIDKENPRGIIGLFDLTARKTVLKSLGADIMTFSVPYGLYQKIEENAEGSFLEKSPWKDIM
jgi:uncharacterized protein (DUF169 family)